MSDKKSDRPDAEGDFKPHKLIAVVLLLFLAISMSARWYSGNVSIPRYCANPSQALENLRQVLTQPEPAGDKPRRPYLIAAKLIFLLPRQSDEPLDGYLSRVGAHIRQQCQ